MLVQYGAIPCRTGQDGAVSILLITSRETRRWIVPRGNPIPGLSPAESSARETYEEAGVRGTIGGGEIGAYRYQKRRRDGSVEPAEVHLFLLLVTEELEHWPEQRHRERRWLDPQSAAGLVDEPELKALILATPLLLADIAPPC